MRRTNKEIRSQWLLSFIVVILSSLLLKGLHLFSASGFSLHVFVEFLKIIAFEESLWAWVTYHCCYKKYGSTWLGLLSAGYPFVIVATIIRLMWAPHLSILWLLNFIGLSSKIWFWINCLHLKTVNREMQRNPEPQKIVTIDV